MVSTHCRGCGNHMSIENGKPVERAKDATRLATSGKPPVEHTTVAPKIPENIKSEADSPGFLKRFFWKEQVKRKVNCYHCGQDLEVAPAAQSTQCSKCGGYISLSDFVVEQSWQKQIQTRGNVTIMKEGSIIGSNIICHDLIVFGKLSASVSCSGKLVIRSDNRIVGNLKCDELRIEKGAHVEIQGEVEVGSAYIDGEVRAQITSVGTITLEKKAHLQGMARAGGLIVASGARHTGLMEVTTPISED